MPAAKKPPPLGGKTGAIKKPKFGGKPQTKVLPPDKKTLESFGGARTKMKPFEAGVPSQQETGFIQATPKQATGAMMGRAPPPLIARGSSSSGPAAKKSRKQFKSKGKKVF